MVRATSWVVNAFSTPRLPVLILRPRPTVDMREGRSDCVGASES